MNKKIFILTLAVFVFITLNICAAQEIENTTVDDIVSTPVEEDIVEISNDTQTLEAASVSTKLSVESKTDFDVIGDYFKVKLTDASNNLEKH